MTRGTTLPSTPPSAPGAEAEAPPPRFLAPVDERRAMRGLMISDLVPQSADCGDLLPFRDSFATPDAEVPIEQDAASVSTDDSWLLGRSKPVL